MQVKEMREILKTQVESIPRSNIDVVKLYNKLNDADHPVPEQPVQEQSVERGEEYTYIGSGDTPPHMIKYMSIQTFVRGNPVRVTDPRVLAKIATNRSFVKGKADMEKVFEQDEIAAKRAQKQREEDLKTQIAVERQNRRA